ncbi:MAG: hydroxyacylglutathione hydrolase [Myxococcota bacterium]
MLELVQLPVWRDNYAYLLLRGQEALVIDPPEASPVLEALHARGAHLVAVLCTHHHHDHTGGNAGLQEATGCAVFGPAHDAERIPALTHPVAPGQTAAVGSFALHVLDVRAHTRGHIAFVLPERVARVTRHGHAGSPEVVPRLANRPLLFCGDSLFLGGCGRLFEGSPDDLARALRTLRAESAEALVCCAHEYTFGNLRFAQHVLRDHEAIATRLAQLDDERGASGSSVPDTLAREIETNPFLLALDEHVAPKLKAALRLPETVDEAALVGALRRAKDEF